MKKIVFVLFLLINAGIVYAQLDTPIKVDKSELKWKGGSAFTSYGHYGTVAFKEGRIQFDDDKLKSGNFVIDMNTIANVDEGYNADLVDHLKNEDFFEVSKYPTAKLNITRVTYDGVLNYSLQVEADLTIKGITHPITFTAQTTKENGLYIFTSKFVIDRSKWNVKYGSESFFKNLGDNALSDEIEFEVKIVAESGC